LNERGLITYRHGTTAPVEQADQDTPSPWRQYEAEDQQRRRRELADRAYEAYRDAVRRRQQADAEDLRRPQYVQADPNILGRLDGILAAASRNQQAHQQNQWPEQQRQRAASEATQLQRSSQQFDDLMRRMQQDQEEVLHQKQVRAGYLVR
jgi:hypothetical protein